MDFIEEARKLSNEYSDKYKRPSFEDTQTAVERGIELAKQLKADERVVIIGCYLMDNGLGEALEKGEVKKHTIISAGIARKFLDKTDLSSSDKDKIINSIIAHHGEVNNSCIESEIVKNADCFKFLDLKRFLMKIYEGSQYGMSFKETMDFLNKKVEEKYKLISLEACKKEADNNYKLIKEFLNKIF
jgi:hypothetical protein